MRLDGEGALVRAMSVHEVQFEEIHSGSLTRNN